MNEPLIRVLHITETLSAAGIESFIMNLYRTIDKSRVQFDFFVLRNEKEFYDAEIENLGGKKYWIQSDKKNTLIKILNESVLLNSFLKTNPYDIVHIHYTTTLRAPYLFACKRANVSTRIYHSHSAFVLGKSKFKMLIYEYMKGVIEKNGTDFFACSEAAAKWIYSENMINDGKVKVIFNGIDVEKFKFDSDRRLTVRKELHIGDEFVIIHTGRFLDQKNHEFILDVFNELLKEDKKAKLLLLGTGELLNGIKVKVNKLGIDSSVVFLGVKDNVYDYLSAADCYIMPSLYEGLPVAAVEAQCSGLPCVFSENITKEIELTKNVRFLSLNAPISNWVTAVKESKNLIRGDDSLVIQKKGYDMRQVALNLQNFYIEASIRK